MQVHVSQKRLRLARPSEPSFSYYSLTLDIRNHESTKAKSDTLTFARNQAASHPAFRKHCNNLDLTSDKEGIIEREETHPLVECLPHTLVAH